MKGKKTAQTLIPAERIERTILLIRGQKVILDTDLAELYGVQTGALNRAVKRNRERFPEDFMFQIAKEEYDDLKCHFGISRSWGGRRRSFPYAFTEHGAIMAASVLNTERAVKVSVYVVRVFVKLRQMLSTHKELAHKLTELERKIETHDEAIRSLIAAIRQLMAPPEPERGKIGFKAEK